MNALPDDPLVSVVLCTYDPKLYAHFAEAARSVRTQRYDPVELVVVVDGSEELFERVEADLGEADDVVLIYNETNLGLLESRNRGVEAATGDIVAFIDDDAVADANWVEELVTTYRAEDAIAAGGRMVPEWVAGKPGFLPEEFYWLVGVTHRGFPEGPTEVRNTFGSNVSFRCDVIRSVGGFDPAIGGRKGAKNLQGGETELCERIRAEHGRGVHYNPRAEVAHKVFAYRTNPWWLLNRAFWQGYSKRVMRAAGADGGGEESSFLARLVLEFGPSRVRDLVTHPSSAAASQFVMLWLLTAAVGAGYGYGFLLHR